MSNIIWASTFKDDHLYRLTDTGVQCGRPSQSLVCAHTAHTCSLLRASQWGEENKGGREAMVVPGREWADRWEESENNPSGTGQGPSPAPGVRVSPICVTATFKCSLTHVTSCDDDLSIHGTSFSKLATCHLILPWCLLLQASFSLWLYIHLWHLN